MADSRIQTYSVVIASGSQVSSIFTMKAPVGGKAFVSSPVSGGVTSCYIQMQGSWDTTSANFRNVHQPFGATLWTWQVKHGGVTVPIDGLESFPYLRFYSSVAQGGTRTFTVGVKL